MGFQKCEHMLLNFSDYICFHINNYLHHRTKFNEALLILSFLLKYTSINIKESIQNLQNIMRYILNTLEQIYTIRNIKPIIMVFNLFFKKVLNENTFKENDDCSNDFTEENVYKNNVLELTKDILKAVINVLTSSDIDNQILALDCLSSGLKCLEHDENLLLPICHQIWKPLLEKFNSNNPVVLYRCCEMLHILSTLSKDFLRQRSIL